MSDRFRFGRVELVHTDCFEWIDGEPNESIHAVVTDPPYGLQEYTNEEVEKLRNGKGGVWRQPLKMNGCVRTPAPRFSTLNADQLKELYKFFKQWGEVLRPKLTPGANVVVATNPLVSYIVSCALADAGLERRGEVVRLTMTMRGGDRPKNAEVEFGGVSVMPRSQWEPWLLFRRPLGKMRIQDSLRKWGTGGFRRIDGEHPFGDVIKSSPTTSKERKLSGHPSLKPQSFMRKIVYAALPLGNGRIVDPFAGGGSTLAAASAVGYSCVGTERDKLYYSAACVAIPKLSRLAV